MHTVFAMTQAACITPHCSSPMLPFNYPMIHVLPRMQSMAARGETFFNGADGTIVRPQEEGGCEMWPPQNISAKWCCMDSTLFPFQEIGALVLRPNLHCFCMLLHHSMVSVPSCQALARTMVNASLTLQRCLRKWLVLILNFSKLKTSIGKSWVGLILSYPNAQKYATD